MEMKVHDDLRELYRRLDEGEFYEDHDEDRRLLTVLKSFLEGAGIKV